MNKIIPFKKKKKIVIDDGTPLIVHKLNLLREEWDRNEDEMIEKYSNYKVFQREFYAKQLKNYKKQFKEYKKFLSKSELKKQTTSDIIRYEKTSKLHNKAFSNFINSVKKLKEKI